MALPLQDGSMFKAQVEYAPYFYLQIKARRWLVLGRVWGLASCRRRHRCCRCTAVSRGLPARAAVVCRCHCCRCRCCAAGPAI